MDITTALILIAIGAVIGGTAVWAALRGSVDRKAHALTKSFQTNLDEAYRRDRERAAATVVPIRRVQADDGE